MGKRKKMRASLKFLLYFSPVLILVLIGVALVSGYFTFFQGIFAASITWTAGDGDWDVATNWSTGSVPGAYDDVVINTAVKVTVKNNIQINFKSLQIGGGAGNSIVYLFGNINNGTDLTIKSNGYLVQKNISSQSLKGNLTIESGGTLTHGYNGYSSSSDPIDPSQENWTDTTLYKVDFNANNITVTGSVNADYRGYRGGKYYNPGFTESTYYFGRGPGGGQWVSTSAGGGAGGGNCGTGGVNDYQKRYGGMVGGVVYGVIPTIIDAGSGGSAMKPTISENSINGGNGGGLIVLSASNNFVLNGTISTKGSAGISDSTGDASNKAHGGGGGAGGSVKIYSNNFSGVGQINVSGGAGGGNYTADYTMWYNGGGGGGGCAYVQYKDSNTTSVTYNLAGGFSGVNHGAPDGSNYADGIIGQKLIEQVTALNAKNNYRLTGWAWSEDIGWLKMNCANDPSDNICLNSNFGVDYNKTTIYQPTIDDAKLIWTLDEPEAIVDWSADKNNGLVSGALSRADGVYPFGGTATGQSLYFPQSGNNYVYRDNINVNITQPFSVSFWKKNADVNTQQTFFSIYNAHGGLPHISVGLFNKKIKVWGKDSSGVAFSSTGGYDLDTYNPQLPLNVVFLKFENKLIVKIINAGIWWQTTTATITDDPLGNQSNITVGANRWSTGVVDSPLAARSLIDEFRVYGRELTSTEEDALKANPGLKIGQTFYRNLSGFAWSEYGGWMCFGTSCSGLNPESSPAVANIEESGLVNGWTKWLTLDNDGWMKLRGPEISPATVLTKTNCRNCTALIGETGENCGYCFGNSNYDGSKEICVDCSRCTIGTCTTCSKCYKYGVALDYSANYLTGWAWNGNADSSGFGWLHFNGGDAWVKADSSYFKTENGDVYAQKGIGSLNTPTLPAEDNFTSAYLLQSNGDIIHYRSATVGQEKEGVSLDFPKSDNNYKSNIGNLDIKGILAGQYGEVSDAYWYFPPTSQVLSGKVYYNSTGVFRLYSGVTLKNGTNNESGAGTLVLRGDLYINDDIICSSDTATKMKNLCSLGIIVLKKNQYYTGNVYIDPSVSRIDANIYAEGTIYTGSTGTNDDMPLEVHGLMVAHAFEFQRNYYNKEIKTPAERIIYDGRVVANPPPGFTDIAKALPTWTK